VSRLTWNAYGERFYELGIDRGVLYIAANPGVAWTGLVSVTERPTGSEPRPYWIDGVKYLNLRSAEEFEATIEAFGAPTEFGPCDGAAVIHTGLVATQQPRVSFGLSYRTKVGNDVEGADHAYKIHIVYNALAAPAQRVNATIAASTDPMKLSWAISTLAPPIVGFRRTAHLVIDSRTSDPAVLAEVEDLLYGTDITNPSLPTPDDLIALFAP